MLELYLSVITKGSCSNGADESLVVEDFDTRISYVTSPISGMAYLRHFIQTPCIHYLGFCLWYLRFHSNFNSN